MRVMVFVKATADSEAGLPPAEDMTEMFAAMGAYNEQLVDAGIMVDGDGLKPSSFGKRIAFDGDSRTVIDGPFASPNELVAGYWIWEVADMEEAIDWAKRCPNPMPGPSELEIRPFYETEDFGDGLTSEQAEQEQKLRERIAQ
ncbi:MAG: YciI family protein [Sphingomonadales bacterium]|nr:YciI family protein [Sphingomonadales bacterium]PIX66990.1 MAG: dehydrogenase [Sphingomonadales bacterium CG_4_10_14_3_um_filter_58_15]NCO50123.1 YciI family protein [Sphingomonadales bacterium]NCO99558.1 YciI family protein [Sphingomonadales bacterium]NCP27686.1 YciI family protein [Sphingomonadales bacterium]